MDGLDGRVWLEGLTDDDVIAFGSTLGHGQLSPRSASRLRRHTGGNPLYLRSLMSELSTEVLEAPGSLPAPQSYALLVLSSVASQSEQARRLARSAAVLADGTPFSLVAALAEVDEPEEALEELTRAQVLTCAQTDEGWRISFAHPLVRAAVYDDLGPLERQKAHQRAAVLCEHDQALFHRLAASSGPDTELAAELAARAGQLHESGDLRQAADYYLKAGHVGGRAGWPWLMDAATLFLIAGDVTAAKEAEELIAEDVGGAVVSTSRPGSPGSADSRAPLQSSPPRHGSAPTSWTRVVAGSSPRSWRSCTTCRPTGSAPPTGRPGRWPRTCRPIWPTRPWRRERWDS